MHLLITNIVFIKGKFLTFNIFKRRGKKMNAWCRRQAKNQNQPGALAGLLEIRKVSAKLAKGGSTIDLL